MDVPATAGNSGNTGFYADVAGSSSAPATSSSAYLDTAPAVSGGGSGYMDVGGLAMESASGSDEDV